ncbi:MAG: TolB-like 6-bladed beta-propeller domain-containing protein [Bacteroidales bacterium]|jgi:hypothetical protein|nr:TolB-like 6-bladed beta-propeller domain-containing protein [Bacteroidales bacterium]
MKNKIVTFISIFFLILACSKKQDENTYSISDEHEYEVKSEIVFAAEGKDSLNYFYDIAIIDSFVILGNFYGDTLMSFYKNLDFSNCFLKIIKGNGPKEFVEQHVQINKAVGFDTITFFEINARRIKKTNITEIYGIQNFESEFLSKTIPDVTEFNMTKKYILGLDFGSRKIFIYNKETNQMILSDYYPKSDISYNKSELSYLYECRLGINEPAETVCGGLISLNCVCFFDFNLVPKKTIIVGDKLYFPKSEPYKMFSNSKFYFLDVCGTNDYVYCLYRGTYQDATKSIKIFVFNWEGEHITTIKTDCNLWNSIAVDKNNRYILGLSYIDNGSTDVVKIPLEGVLKSNINEL